MMTAFIGFSFFGLVFVLRFDEKDGGYSGFYFFSFLRWDFTSFESLGKKIESVKCFFSNFLCSCKESYKETTPRVLGAVFSAKAKLSPKKTMPLPLGTPSPL